MIMSRLLGGFLVVLLGLTDTRISLASEGFEPLVQLVKAGADEKTVLDYVAAAPTVFTLTVDEILFLSDLGLSPDTIKAISEHGQKPDVGVVVQPAGIEAVAETPVMAPPASEMVQETVLAPPVMIAPPAEAVDDSSFYEGLAPYGNWVDLDGEWYWQPTAMLVDHGWSPYCQRGNWVYSDWGWAWESSYSWGWAPFHYGRWRRHSQYGWIWRPDRVWGPAWVTWRYSDTDIGWAPLPPEVTFDVGAGLMFRGRSISANFDCGLGWQSYTFVPAGRFNDFGLERHRYPRSRVEPVYQSATVVQSRFDSRDSRIINIGPPPGHISAATHQEIHPRAIMAHSIHAGDPIPRTRTTGSTLSFYRPVVAPTTHGTPRQVVLRNEIRERDRHEAIRHDEVFTVQRNPAEVTVDRTRGRQSRNLQPVAAPPVPSPTPDIRRREQERLTGDVARQRQAEEAAARQQEEVRHRAAELIQVRNRDAVAVRQQEAQRRAQDMSHQQESRRQIEEAARAADVQRQALKVQRESEEAEARRQESQTRSRQDPAAAPRQRDAIRTQPEILPDYGNPSLTGAASGRGANSRKTDGGNADSRGTSPGNSKERNKQWTR